MNSEQKSSIPSINSQGKITTQNPELLSLLRENSSDRTELAELSSPSRNVGVSDTYEPVQPQRPMQKEPPHEYHDDRRGQTDESSTRGIIPERSSGSPTRSKSVASVKEHGIKPEYVSERDSFIDSLDQPRRSEKLEDSLELDNDPSAKHYDAQQHRSTPTSYPKPVQAQSSSELIRPSSRTVQKASPPFEPEPSSSYSSRRLKGRDSSQRTLSQVRSTSDVARESPKDYSSNTYQNDDKNSYHFSPKDTAPIRDLLNIEAEEEVESNIENPNTREHRLSSSQTYKVLPKAESTENRETELEKRETGAKPEIHVERMDPSPPGRMYVDSPTFTPQEEEEYRFVQSRLDDQDDFKDNATYRELDRNALKGDEDVALESNREWNRTNHKSNNQPHGNVQKQYVLRPSSQKPTSTNPPQQTGPSQRELVHSETPEPFIADSMETSTEDSELEREKRYQKELQERLANQVVTDTDILIPRLNLPDESVEYVRDSLDYDDDDTYRDTDKTMTEFAVHDNGEWVNPPQNPYHYQQNHVSNNDYRAYQNVPEHYSSIEQGHQGYQHYPAEHAHQLYQPLNQAKPQQHQHIAQSAEVYQHYPAVNTQQQYQPQSQAIYNQQQFPYQGQPYEGYEQYYPIHQSNQHPQGTLARYPTQTEAEYFIELPQTENGKDSSASKSPRKPPVDYVEKNKQNIYRSKPGTTYSELKQRKFHLEQQKVEKPESRNIVKIGKAVKPVQEQQTNMDNENESFVQGPNNAESTWKNRSAFLAQQKQGKTKSKKVGKLQKYPTDHGFIPMNGQQGSGQNEFVNDHRNDDRAALSTGDLSPSRRPLVLKPITQEVWTEDGQRISVDINLKVMSPPPATGPAPFMGRQHPLGPISQDQHGSGPQVIYSARGPPTEWEQASNDQGSPFRQGQGYPAYGPLQRNAISGHVGYGRQNPHSMVSDGVNQIPGQPLRNDFDKFRKHQHNVEQQQLVQQQIYQQQLARKQQLKHQLQQLQMDGHQNQGQSYHQRYGEEDVFEGGYPSQRDQIDAPNLEFEQQNHPMSTAAMNPYNRIPPISNDRGRNYAQPKESPLGYAHQFYEKKSKEQRKPDYKVYTVEDYRKMQKEVRLGGLGPDLDSETYREKAGKKIRQENYARDVKMRNKLTAPKTRPPVYPKQKETDDLLPRSTVAKEYAKNVPKPKVRPKENQFNSYEVSAQMSPVGMRKQIKPTQSSPRQSPKRTTPTKNIDVIDLQKLHDRHERDKQNVAMIRQNMEIS